MDKIVENREKHDFENYRKITDFGNITGNITDFGNITGNITIGNF